MCHCNVSAYDGKGNISSKPTIYIDAENRVKANKKAIETLEETYKGYGSTHVSVGVSILKEI